MFYYYGIGFETEKSAENFRLSLKCAPPLKEFLPQIHYISEETSEIILDISLIYTAQCKGNIERLFPNFDFNKAIKNLISRT